MKTIIATAIAGSLILGAGSVYAQQTTPQPQPSPTTPSNSQPVRPVTPATLRLRHRRRYSRQPCLPTLRLHSLRCRRSNMVYRLQYRARQVYPRSNLRRSITQQHPVHPAHPVQHLLRVHALPVHKHLRACSLSRRRQHGPTRAA